MSLEDALNTHSAAMNRLADTLAAAAAAAQTGAAEPTPLPDASAGSLAPTPAAPTGRPVTPGKRANAAAGRPAAPGATATTTAQPSYEDVRLKVLKLAEVKGHPLAVATLAEFGVKNGKDLKPEQFAAAIARIDQVLGAPAALA